jgi:hypothetical protein
MVGAHLAYSAGTQLRVLGKVGATLLGMASCFLFPSVWGSRKTGRSLSLGCSFRLIPCFRYFLGNHWWF